MLIAFIFDDICYNKKHTLYALVFSPSFVMACGPGYDKIGALPVLIPFRLRSLGELLTFLL